jgi:Uma2 family endonuclease
MSTNPIKLYSVKEYFEIEKKSPVKHEFVYGEIFAMGGASERHNAIASSIQGELYPQLKGTTCRIYQSDMRTRINDQLYYYPDVVVGCNIRLEIMDKLETLVNPILVIEVLSRSTARYDRDTKLREYQQVESLRYYLMVAQNEINATLFARADDGSWANTTYTSLDNIIELPLINARLLVSDIYLNAGF